MQTNNTSKDHPFAYLEMAEACENLAKIARKRAAIAGREIGRVVGPNTPKSLLSSDAQLMALDREFERGLAASSGR
jgi:hypothetical protein